MVEPEQDQRPIEQQFVESWDEIESFYNDIAFRDGWSELKPIFGLISELRSRGYDRQLRAGQSLVTFILSRSKAHGLRDDQAFLHIHLSVEGHSMIVTYVDPPNPPIEAKFDRVELVPELEQLLQRLLTHPIN